MFKLISMVFISCLLGVSGQISLKIGMNHVGRIGKDSLMFFWPLMLKVISSPLIWLGLFFYALSFVWWLVILSRVNLSLAYPLISMNFILVILAAWLFLHEPVSINRILGVIIICSGIMIIK
ncbi:MAG: EamA family transporter [Armatimonadetes bacterium]|nr:EamA family transporter [Armatimonadota bacterium]